MNTPQPQTVNLDAPVTFTRQGQGSPVILLHGGGGPLSLQGFATMLAEKHQVLIPIHPGFAGTPRPDTLKSIKDLARLYVRLIEHLELKKVTVMGFSMGGWIASELALRQPPQLKALILVNAVGFQLDGHPVADVFTMPPQQLAELSYHNSEHFAAAPLSPEQLAARQANFATLAHYDQNMGMGDLTLKDRLSGVQVPTLVAWGESDGLADLDYGQAYASSIPGAEFSPVPEAGHLPQLEQPQELLDRVEAFLSRLA